MADNANNADNPQGIEGDLNLAELARLVREQQLRMNALEEELRVEKTRRTAAEQKVVLLVALEFEGSIEEQLAQFADHVESMPQSDGRNVALYDKGSAATPKMMSHLTLRTESPGVPGRFEDLPTTHRRDSKEAYRLLRQRVRRLADKHALHMGPGALQLPEGPTGSKGDQANQALGAKSVLTPLLPLATLLQLAAAVPGVVSLELVLQATRVVLTEAHRVAADLHLSAQFYRAAGSAQLSKQFISDALDAQISLDEMKERVRTEIARLETEKASKATVAALEVSTKATRSVLGRDRTSLSGNDQGGFRGRGGRGGNQSDRGRGGRGRGSQTPTNFSEGSTDKESRADGP